ncbi:polysaccharide deacetylase family protein [Solirubrobacter sp. CPCC 204708]|uniref:Polysaccharide deacetylase family protein n=1 Tax=Solirubrobacter deserti TaxID=2282478 RepID=A0ABT4RQ04_9ACTN|nr:polysaccharide deacetylase family protein [Solirubrobacter deserti]MBE2319918.1 polysaccharide deacetylase family protein [Solirubrobacter deserti]MDA0140488.1 polysaccharide deacetylase family protein [Solirubrobacter deserti]
MLREALDALAAPVDVFFRDDDAGWEDARLFELLARFAEHGLPVDLAVIPADLHDALAARLIDSHAGLHQHGYAHTNHEVEGRKCEFGPARDKAAQNDDIARGRTQLRERLGDRLDPFFTPPWNRCTRDTAEVLVELGFSLLSREHKAEPFGLLPELPVHLDVARLSPQALDERFAAQLRTGGPVGVMFHHGVMEAEDMARASELLQLLANHEQVRPCRMAELCH